MLVEQYKAKCKIEADKLGTSSDVHPEDLIFQFLFTHPAFQANKESAVEYYFQNGFESAGKLLYLIKEICGYNGIKNIQLLEFASGFGCVTRHLKKLIPFAEITACDIHPLAAQFYKEKLNTEFILSTSRPEDLVLKQKFDVIFALSFFSHMPKSSFTRWMRQLLSFLKPGGFLIFTTHGVESKKILANGPYDEDGFSFIPSSEQYDIDSAEYGITVTLPKYVTGQIFSDLNCELVYFHEAHWWTHQDVYIVKRIGDQVHQPNFQSQANSDSLAIGQTQPAEVELMQIKNSKAWNIIQFIWKTRVLLFPHGSKRERLGQMIMNKLHTLRAKGSGV